MHHVLVETIEGYKSYKQQNNGKNIIYYSSNEEIILYLKSQNEKVKNIEIFLDKDEVNNIGKLSYTIQEKISDLLNQKCKILDNLKLGNILHFTIFQSFFILIYKQTLLNRLKKNNNNSKIICVGNPEPMKHPRIDLYFDRFDNIFSLLAKNSNDESISNYEHILDQLIQKNKRYEVENIKLSKIEKIFSVVDNSLASFFFKVFKYLPITNFIFKKKKIHIYGYNENIANLFFYIIKKKYNIKFLEKPHKRHLTTDDNKSEKYNFKIDLKNTIEQEVKKNKINIKDLEVPISIFIKRLLFLVNKFNYHQDQIKNYYLELTKNINSNEIVLSNGFYQTEDKILYHFIKKKNAKVISFDHGISIGMDKIRSSYVDKYTGIIGDIGVYSNYKGRDSIKGFYPSMKPIVTGQIDYYKEFFNIKKFILKFYYNISLKKKVIFIVIGPQYNNTFFSPYRERDRKIVKINKRVVAKICNEKKDHQIVLKLYPGARYYNEYSYRDLENFNNLKIIRDKDFRWLRYMADIVITHCSDSTLGQLNNIDAKSFFYTFNDRPNNFEEKLESQTDFRYLKNIKLIKKGSILPKTDYRELLKEF